MGDELTTVFNPFVEGNCENLGNQLSRNAQAVIDLLDQHGVYGLAGSDGCRCAHFSVQQVNINISCHKSNGGIKWHHWGVIRITGSGDLDMQDLGTIAGKLLELLTEKEWEDERDDPYWTVRFCRWECDEKQICVYCGQSREVEQGYLCNKCLTAHSPYGPEYKLADRYDFTRIRIASPLPITV